MEDNSKTAPTLNELNARPPAAARPPLPGGASTPNVTVMNHATMRERREAAGLTLEAAAEMIGLEPHQLAGVENGWRKLTHAQARKAAQMLAEAGY